MGIVERIDTVCLKVSNIERASLWYEEILGLKVSFKDEHYVILSVEGTGVPLTLERGVPSPNENTTYPIFFSANLTETFRVLQENKVEVSEIQIDGVKNF
ncbi:VOC family protein [Psychrobacillus vulpis]|uniref:Glyoxalase/fosfomycin resistance/dioxygenase domain-containing protein n=1 Tax=Psychrobacillus vulpis TaxID=2325572 RepID=A0A544TUA5_9BACI|nr:VOC family protein [Psychrobacillus vulpis]TQR21034.1 hypothetical protein FG384_05415 [Psychrobacillus vulpis]